LIHEIISLLYTVTKTSIGLTMIKSMTAYAGTEKQFPFGRLALEIRSVNHRYLDIHPHLPEDFRALEPAIRERLADALQRGKIDINLRFHPQGTTVTGGLKLNQELATALLDIHEQLEKLSGQQQDPSLLTLMRWPDLLLEETGDMQPIYAAALKMLDEVLVELVAARQREGEKIEQMIIERLDGIDTWVHNVSGWLPEIREKLRQRLTEKVTAFAQQSLDPGRLEQEIAILAQKMDVDEELDRLGAHISEARHILQRNEAVGRRLDFLMQEFNRESNTLGSKSVDEKTSKASVELKVLIEQMREQIQNVE